MDKIDKYRSIISNALECYQSYASSDMPNVYNKVITSEDKNTYILMVIGWHEKNYHHILAIHIEIKNGKVWIHEDKTDFGISLTLEEHGIPSKDIVLGFAQPYELSNQVEVFN